MDKNGDQNLISQRVGHLVIAACLGFNGGYNLWLGLTGALNGTVWVFAKQGARFAARAMEPGFYWATMAGRLGFGVLLSGTAAYCLWKAIAGPGNKSGE